MSSFFVENQSGDNIGSSILGKQLLHSGRNFNSYKVRVGLKWYVRKELADEFKTSDFHQNILRKEFEIGQNLNHPNIAQYHTISNDDDGLFLLKEYIDGITLSPLIFSSQHYFASTRKFVEKFVEQIGSAVQYMHSKNIIHGDLSPKNIIYNSSQNQFYLIDFGHAHLDNYISLGGGTDNFIAPELLNHLFPISLASDIYSIGKLLQLIVGQSDKTKYQKTILGCCDPVPNKRFQNVAELKVSLARTNRIIPVTIIIFALSFLFWMFYNHSYFNTTIQDKRSQISNPNKAIDTNIEISPDVKNNAVIKKQPTIPKLNKYEEKVMTFGFLDSFKRNISDTIGQSDLRRIRDLIIVNKNNEFKKWLNLNDISNSDKLEYKQAYYKQYYNQRMKSDSLIQIFN